MSMIQMNGNPLSDSQIVNAQLVTFIGWKHLAAGSETEYRTENNRPRQLAVICYRLSLIALAGFVDLYSNK